MSKLYLLTETQKNEAEFHSDMLFRIIKKITDTPTRANIESKASIQAIRRFITEIQKFHSDSEIFNTTGEVYFSDINDLAEALIGKYEKVQSLFDEQPTPAGSVVYGNKVELPAGSVGLTNKQ